MEDMVDNIKMLKKILGLSQMKFTYKFGSLR